ncbi:MAG TPA: methylated-DNA--[protein]-cysteine S-methyltransferase [Thermoanaerobaculia bacterium]|nr:methylated-DNA--[protein]-cysteine S-methyltransferase [Thermoanaerobaculia bacterium]
MTTWYTTTVESPCGPLFCVVDEAGAVVRIEFENGRDSQKLTRRLAEKGFEVVEDSERTAEVRRQLEEYFAGERQTFNLTLAPEGTDFERSVWNELSRIPFGETRSYAEIARAIGRPGAARAVGRANGANPIPIVVPCHRVIGANGSLTGFGGGLPVKSLLLEIEGAALPFSKSA